jgi:hypothetical protein
MWRRRCAAPGGRGSKDAFWADITPYESGSDHWIYQEGAFGIPAIYLRDHPDIYIHTTGDVADNIEPTKIKRSAFIAAASGYYLATMADHGAALLRLTYANAHERLAEDGRRALALANTNAGEAANIVTQAVRREQRRLRSLSRFVDLDSQLHLGASFLESLGANLADVGGHLLQAIPTSAASASGRATDTRVPVRNAAVKGPLAPNGEWVMEKAGAPAAAAGIARAPNSGDLTYEIVNFIDGVRTVRDIRDELSVVAEYLDLLAKAGAVTFKR